MIGPADFGRIRLSLLAAASLIAPTVLVSEFRFHGQVADLPVIAGLSAFTFLLVLGRMAGIPTNQTTLVRAAEAWVMT